MRRRTLLVGCLPSVVIPGCLGAPSSGEDEADANEIQQAYVIHLEPADDGVDEEAVVCEFDELPEAAQDEIEEAVDREQYRVAETPELMMRNCHNGYVEYEGELFWLRITIESG